MPAGAGVVGVGWVAQLVESVGDELTVRVLEPGLVWRLWRHARDLGQTLHHVHRLLTAGKFTL